MSRALRNAAAMKRAQFAFDNMVPPEDGPSECPECAGTGTNSLIRGDRDDTCQCCGGSGYVDENGEPYDPAEAERERDEYADMQRDRQGEER